MNNLYFSREVGRKGGRRYVCDDPRSYVVVSRSLQKSFLPDAISGNVMCDLMVTYNGFLANGFSGMQEMQIEIM